MLRFARARGGFTSLLAAAVLCAFAGVMARPAPSAAQTPPPAAGRDVAIYLFWGDGCPHCAAEKTFLERLRGRYPGIDIRAYEVWNSAPNRAILQKMAAAYGFEPKAVPTTFIGGDYWVGYSDVIAGQIERAVVVCRRDGCRDAGAGIIAPAAPVPTAAPATAQPQAPAALELPLLGAVDPEAQPLVISTALIGFVDGFNPCSLWALTVLLAITLHTGSRRKVLIIGLVYITVTALIYALFIAGLFTAFTFTGFTGWIQIVVALVALVFALVNIKDYFYYKQGPSLTIDDAQKPVLIRRMHRLTEASQSTGGLVLGTVALATGVSLIEFSCTAGFPILWTNLLAAQQVTAAAFLLLLLVYLVIYQLDELVIFFIAVGTLRVSRLEEKHGRVLKLLGGVLMLTLAIVILISPGAMSSLSNTLLIFGGAMAAALIILVIHRRVLPHFGIRIGSEAGAQTPRKRPAGKLRRGRS